MKKPTRIMVLAIVIVGLVGGVLFIKNKFNDKAAKLTSQNQSVEVKEGKLSVNVSGSGSVVSKDQNNKENNNLEVHLEIDELDISKVKINQPVKLTIDALSGKIIDAIVSEVSQVGNVNNGVSTFVVKVDILNSIIKIASVEVDNLIVREGSNNNFRSVDEVKRDSKVEILSKDDNWYKIKTYNNKVGWVNKESINIVGVKNGQQIYANDDSVNIRKGPLWDYDIEVKAIKGDELNLLEKNGDWLKVKLEDNTEGWVHKDDINVNNVKVGMSVSASILSKEKEKAIFVPIEGVSKKEDGSYYVIDSNSLKPRAIEVGIHNEDVIEITSGLKVGDKIKTSQPKNVDNKIPKDSKMMMKRNNGGSQAKGHLQN